MAEIKKFLGTEALGALVDQIKAEDAKVLAAAQKYTDDAGKLYDAAGSAATAESNAKAYTDELANGQVKTNKEAIATLNGEGEGSVKKAVADAKALIDADVDAVEAKANKNAEDIAAINNEETGILAQAKADAKDKADAVQANVDTVAGDLEDLESYVGTFTSENAKSVVEYIDEKTAGIASDAVVSALGDRVTQAEKDIDAIEADYLKAADKTELQGKIDSEAATRKSDDEALAARIKTVEDDYLKAADKTELQGNIDTVNAAVERLTNGVSSEEIDGVNDLIQYVKDHGTEVTGMQEDIADNASAIEGVAGRMTTAEGKITAVEGAVATKAEKTYVDEAVEALEGADTAIKGRLDALEGAIGESGSVAEDIATAKQEAIDAAASAADAKDAEILAQAKKYADDEDAKIESRVDALETASATHALASDLTALAGKVTTAEGEIDTLQTEMDAVEKKASDNETAIGTINTELAKKAAQADLEAAVARIAVNEGAISTLNTTVAGKADADDLDDAVERIAKNETDIAALTSSVNSFTAITKEEVNALFA